MRGKKPRQRCNNIDPEDIDPAFGHWLAGFVDGEAHFMFSMRQGSPEARLSIELRSDDHPLLVEVQRTLGIGTIIHHKNRARGNQHASDRWHVSALHDCLWLARLFELYPLRSKKARDFEVWSAAIRAWANGAGKNDLRDYAERIRATRQFDATPTASVPAPDAVQNPLL